ncbi:MAG: S9 family peptidase [Nitrospirae bacterium]|nr:MAG: S9 family peptidase [Nitrospirota bacterium]
MAAPNDDPLSPPQAKVVPTPLKKHGHVRIDPYYWMKDRDNPEVLDYLARENAYTKAVLAPHAACEEALFHEIVGRIKPADSSVPYKLDDYLYYTRFEEGQEYPLYCRKLALDPNGPEEIMLDANQLAQGHAYFALGEMAVSFNQDLLAYACDTQGRRIYTIYMKHLPTGQWLSDCIPDVTGNMAWANDNCTLFYSKQDPVTLRSYRIYRHQIGTPCSTDQLVYEELDETFSTAVFKTKSKRFVMIASHHTTSTEYRYLEADDPLGTFRVVASREPGHEYHVEHFKDYFYIRTNLGAPNFRLMRTPVAHPGKDHWEEVIPHRESVLLESFELFRDYLVLEERRDGLIHLRIRPWEGESEHEVDFDEPAYSVSLGENPEFDTSLLRFVYTSLTTPPSTYDYHMQSREKQLLKREEVVGDFDPRRYRTERLWAPARDGVHVPISLVYRPDRVTPSSQAPLLLYGYGAYGISMDASFSSPRLSLLDRGIMFAIAHVRGGEELGRQWYEQGKLLHKKNTFTDFIDCAEYLIRQGYTSSERLFAMGGSAGGLLVGAVINMRPELFHGAIAQVPFVDVLTTMLDPSIPLTTGEYDEWGDPNDKEYYDYILSYSPYDNVVAQSYPHLFVTAGLHDSQVQYWEPAKWVAKLRATKTDTHRLLLQTNMEAGHSGASGRFRRYRELATIYTFLLDLTDRLAPAPSSL